MDPLRVLHRPQGARRHTLRLGTRVVGSLLRSPRHSRTVSDGDAPVLPIGAVPRYGKLDVRSAFVTVLSDTLQHSANVISVVLFIVAEDDNVV